MAARDGDLRRSLVDDEDTWVPMSTTKPFAILLMSLVLHFINYAICVPILSFYIFDMVSKNHGFNISATAPCSNTTNDSNHAVGLMVQKEVAQLTFVVPFIWFFPGLIPTLVLGPLLDRVGRKLGLLIPMIGTFLKELIYAVVIWRKLPLRIMFIGNGIEGLTGGFAAILMSAFVMVADLSLPGQQRTFRISVVEASQAIASSVSMFAVGFGIKYIGYLHCILIALLLNLVNLCFVIACLPETLEVRKRTPVFVMLKNIKNCFTFYTKDNEENRRVKMVLALVAFLLTVAVNMSKPGVMNILLAKSPLCWSELKINVVTSLQIVSNWVVILVFMAVVQKLLRLEDTMIGVVGSVSAIVACFIMAFADTNAMVYTVVGTSVFMRVTIPMLRSIMSQSVQADEQGALYAGMGCVEMVCAAVVGTLTILMYEHTVAIFPGAVFILLGLFMVVVFVIFVVLILRRWSGVNLRTVFTRL